MSKVFCQYMVEKNNFAPATVEKNNLAFRVLEKNYLAPNKKLSPPWISNGPPLPL